MRKALAHDAARLRELSLLVPAAQAVEFVTTDFHVHVLHRDKVGQRAYFILSCQNHVGSADRLREAEFFEFREALSHVESSVSIDARAGNSFVKSHFGRPLRNGIFAFRAFVEADLHGLHFVQHFRGALDQDICESGGGTSVDDCGPIFFLKAFGVGELLGFERVARQVRTQVQIVRAEAQGRAHHNLIEDGC